MSNIIQITSNNFNGQYADITFYPCSGGSINLGYQLLPYDYAQDNYEGTYDIYVSAYTLTCQLVIACPSPTPTNTPTMTVTPTVTVTPTMTVTPTNTVTPTPTVSPGPAFDPDAATYLAAVISAGGTTDSTISAATNTLFIDLKSNGLYSKLDVFYPVVGATQASHGIMGNRVSGTTYDITWGGGMTHGISGMTGVGTATSWGDLKYYGSGTTLGDRHFSLYSFIENTSAAYDLASDENGIILGYGSTSWYGLMDATAYDPMSVPSTRGMYVTIEPALNTQRNFRNGTNTGNYSRTSNRYNDVKFAIGSKNSGTGQVKSEFSLRGYNWISIGKGLTDTEAQTLSNIINTFQTTLGRNTY